MGWSDAYDKIATTISQPLKSLTSNINHTLIEHEPAFLPVTPAVKYGVKHLVDLIRQPDGKSLGTPGQVI